MTLVGTFTDPRYNVPITVTQEHVSSEIQRLTKALQTRKDFLRSKNLGDDSTIFGYNTELQALSKVVFTDVPAQVQSPREISETMQNTGSINPLYLAAGAIILGLVLLK